MTGFGWWPEAGVAGLILAVVLAFLGFMKSDRAAFLDVIKNHLTHSDKTAQELTLAIKELTIRLSEKY